ncbi:hypothetical protein R8Z57_15110 [Microbacterium sp. M3]|uniref:Transcriptional regulator, AbiEi antitoxin, Type IV TA system n=2 Tax=Microbacterium arthrosphaerae TaxID=792652 RepID=A0ABU4H437_9MICO|nr:MULTISPECIES: hypothetical protein [Microbacterium]MDW4574108.1 hypothetical protein [Microbacterium arthrosphaerae]MDW7607963.1 hypothetical protein [Microbacterium sp. M3]
MNARLSSALLLSREQPFEVVRLDRDRQLHRIRAGAYVRKDFWDRLAPWERYRMRVLAVARTWDSPIFCLESAAVLQGLPVFGEPTHIHVLSTNSRSWCEGDVIVHGHSDEREVMDAAGTAVTSLADTAVDLARVLPPAFALAVVDAAARLLAKRGETLEVAERGRAQADRRGVRQLDWVQARFDPISESVGEAVSRAVIEWLGYDAPVLQRIFTYEGETDRSDFYWPRLRIVGESDGYGKYDADDPEVMRAHFVREKKREDRLRRHEGGFARWDWADTLRFEPLDQKLRATGLAPAHPRQSLMLHTLAHNPRSFPPPTKGSSPKPRTTS